jgi:hypothetical protein
MLRRYRSVVIDLKPGAFKPEYAGKTNFYLSAVDDMLRHPDDKPSIGLILCKAKNGIVAEYAGRCDAGEGRRLQYQEFEPGNAGGLAAGSLNALDQRHSSGLAANPLRTGLSSKYAITDESSFSDLIQRS